MLTNDFERGPGTWPFPAKRFLGLSFDPGLNANFVMLGSLREQFPTAAFVVRCMGIRGTENFQPKGRDSNMTIELLFPDRKSGATAALAMHIVNEPSDSGESEETARWLLINRSVLNECVRSELSTSALIAQLTGLTTDDVKRVMLDIQAEEVAALDYGGDVPF